MTVYNFVALSAASFYGVKLFAKHVIAEKYLKSTDYRQVWLWRNTFCSLVHSFLTAPWTMYWYEVLYMGTKYLRMDQVKFFKGRLPQILLGSFLNTLSHIVLLWKRL